MSKVDRTLTAPESSLRLDAGERWPFYDGQFKHVDYDGTGEAQYINPGLSFGVTQNLEFGFVLPYRASEPSDFEDPRLHMLYQFKRGRVDVGVFGGLRVGAFDTWVVTGGVPVFFHWNDNLRLDTGGFVSFPLRDGTAVSLTGPAEFVFQITPHFFIGPETGIAFNNMFGDGGFDVAVPVGGFIGGTIATSGGLLGDIYGRVRTPDIDSSFTVIEYMVGLEFYFDM